MPESDIIYVGNDMAELLESVPATVDFDEDAIVGAELNYRVKWDSAVSLVQNFKQHPDFPFMTRKSAQITREEAGWSTVKITFEGISDTEAKYSVRGTTSTEPIESHPDFTEFAGKWYDATTWVNGAEFIKKGQKDQGKFLGFRVEDPGEDPPEEGEESNQKAGVKSYLEGGMLFRETLTVKEDDTSGARNAADMEDLGKISEPPNVNTFVQIEDGRNWLLVTCSIEEVGKGIKVTREWRLSGRNGWDPDIYEEA